MEQPSNLQDSTVSALENPPVQPENKSQSILQSRSQVFFDEKDIAFSSLGTANPFLDYALVKLKPEDSRLRQNKAVRVGSCDYHRAFPTDVASLNRGGAVIAFTGSGQIIRTLSFMTSLASHVTQELWTVNFAAKSLARGVCGSMVVDPATSEYVGHIIAGDPLSGSALIVSASDVMNDIRKRSGGVARLSAAGADSLWSTQSNETLLKATADIDNLGSMTPESGTLDTQAPLKPIRRRERYVLFNLVLFFLLITCTTTLLYVLQYSPMLTC